MAGTDGTAGANAGTEAFIEMSGVRNMAEYVFPSINDLSESSETSKYQRQEVVSQKAEKLLRKFTALGMDVKMLDCHCNSFALLIKLQLGENVTQKMVRECWKDIEPHG